MKEDGYTKICIRVPKELLKVFDHKVNTERLVEPKLNRTKAITRLMRQVATSKLTIKKRGSD